MKKIIYIFIFLFIFLSFFYLRSNDKIDVSPLNLNKNHICASDNMIIINYNGPKAQILWNDNSRSFYCEVKEAFYDNLDKIKRKNIKAFYVQDFSDLKWGSYLDKWILAKDAYYVIDSNKDGAMGITYVPFSNFDFANAFLKENGGKLIKFDDITFEVLFNSSKLLKNRLIN